jgi:hypothetical protein
MSMEAGLAAAAEIDANESRSSVSVNQAIQAAHEWTMAQNFELRINEAAESSLTGAAACQQADLTCKKAAIQYNELSSQLIPEMHVWPQDQSGNLGKRLIDYAEQYSQRAKNIFSEIDGTVDKMGGISPTSATAPSSSAQPLNSAFSPADALRTLERGFEFAIETSLISNASTLSTRIFNQLMKEQ